MTHYDQNALQYAEKYGIISYRVTGRYMIYNKSFPKYLRNEAYTVQFKIDLDTMSCIKSTTLKRVMKDGYNNR